MPKTMESSNRPGRWAVVILAAGRSSRMGRPKLLLPWGNTTVLGHLIDQWQLLGAAQVAVVCAAGDALISGELDRLSFPAADRIANPDPDCGMFSSIQCAARWNGWQAGLSHWSIALGDQPHLRLATLRRLLALAASAPERVCQPARLGKPRHPVILPKPVLRALARSDAENLKKFLAQHDVTTFEADDPGLDLDIDRPEDYRTAKGLKNSEIRNPKQIRIPKKKSSKPAGAAGSGYSLFQV